MYLKKITLNGFKNYAGTEFSFVPGINFLFGPNGSGKTNLLDAVHYLSVCKSFLVNTDVQNIKVGQGFFFIEGEVVTDGENSDILQCAVKKGEGKVFRRNKKEYEKLSDHIGYFPSVVIAPSDHDLLHGGSVERRKFLDSLISTYDRTYLEKLIQYGRILEQRNAFLKQSKENGIFRSDLVDIYDSQLTEHAAYIHAKRLEMAKEMIPDFFAMYAELAGEPEQPELRLKADMNDDFDLVNLLTKSRERDLMLGYTSVGPHKDDLEFFLSGRPVKSAASQGQQKTFLTALKLARFRFVHQKTGKVPVLLLDDIFDKLDRSRVRNLVSIISAEPFGQVFITDTEKERISGIMETMDSDAAIFEITNEIPTHEETL